MLYTHENKINKLVARFDQLIMSTVNVAVKKDFYERQKI